jgi:hypothetical protein
LSSRHRSLPPPTSRPTIAKTPATTMVSMMLPNPDQPSRRKGSSAGSLSRATRPETIRCRKNSYEWTWSVRVCIGIDIAYPPSPNM